LICNLCNNFNFSESFFDTSLDLSHSLHENSKVDEDVFDELRQLTTEEEQTTQWPTEEEQTTQWPTEEEQTTQWPTEEEQTAQWPTEEEQTTQWPTEEVLEL
jgi:hypothetical protein